MLQVKVLNNRVQMGMRFSASFQRTDRMAQGVLARRPVSHGQLPVVLAGSLVNSLSTDVSDGANLIVPCEEDEAVWLGFCGENSRRIALKIRQEEVNAVTGNDWNESLQEPQDYLVPPDQASWYGIASGDGHLRQFSRAPVELIVYEPKQPVDPPTPRTNWYREFHGVEETPLQPGTTDFKVVPDPYDITFWSTEPSGRVSIYFVDSEGWKSLTGEAPPSRKLGYRGTLLP
jgi:hypothetical protein